MVTRYFLGANTGAGFYSLYDGFCRGRRDFLWVIKGGPGGGKSGFMKRVGALAEQASLDVEYILCSGDPDSLDGVYIPSLHTAWVDGTAPHVIEPELFGGTGAYLDLGVFCDVDAARRRRDDIGELTRAYREQYGRAYACLKAASAVDPRGIPGLLSDREISAARRRAAGAASRELPRPGGREGLAVRRFLGAVTCRGTVACGDTFSALCKRSYVLDDRYGLSGSYLEEIARQARCRGVDAILCPDPAAPERLFAVMLPQLSLGFVCRGAPEPFPAEADRHVRLDAMVDIARLRELRRSFRRDAGVRDVLTGAATEALAGARAIHDRLESIYNPLVDFDGIYTLAEERFLMVAGK